jgi:hypothetical protein
VSPAIDLRKISLLQIWMLIENQSTAVVDNIERFPEEN